MTGILLPLYIYPSNSGATWGPLLKAHQTYPRVPVIAIVNPSNGPGSALDPNYAAGINALRAAGIPCIGYIGTSYAGVSLSSLEAQIGTIPPSGPSYTQFYSIDGIFFDVAENLTTSETYYNTLVKYANSVGYAFTVVNPGTSVPPGYVAGVGANVMNIYEYYGLPTLSTIQARTSGAPGAAFSWLAHDVGTLDPNLFAQLAQYVGYQYAAPAAVQYTWDSFPSYLDQEFSILSSAPGPSPPLPGPVGCNLLLPQIKLTQTGYNLRCSFRKMYPPKFTLSGSV